MLRDLWLVLCGKLSAAHLDYAVSVHKYYVDKIQAETNTRLEGIETELLKLRADLVATFNDPADPKGYAAHKSISDQLNAKMQARLIAEDKARRHTTGEL